MNTHLIFQELRDLKRKVREQKESVFNTLYNQLILAEETGTDGLNNIIRVDFDNVDLNRTDAERDGYTFFSLDNAEKNVITNDYTLTGLYGDFTVFVKKTEASLSTRVYVSNEKAGEFWVELDKEKTEEEETEIKETFKVSKNLGERARFKVVIEGTGNLTGVSVIYQ